MTAKSIRSRSLPISSVVTLATANDLNGTNDNTQAYDVTGAQRIFIVQVANGTAGTTGIDVIQISHDGGANWTAVTDLVPAANNDFTGDVAASGALNAAGVEPTASGVFRCGPYDGPTAIRCVRDTDGGGGDDWTTGAPSVYMFAVGLTGGAPTALA